MCKKQKINRGTLYKKPRQKNTSNRQSAPSRSRSSYRRCLSDLSMFLTHPYTCPYSKTKGKFSQHSNFRGTELLLKTKRNQLISVCTAAGSIKLRQPFRPPFRLARKSVCSTMVTYNNWWFIILLYLFRQERDGLRHVPSETFVVPRCLATCKPSGAARAQHPLGTTRSESVFSMGSCPAQPIFNLNRIHKPTKLIR